MKQTLAKIVTSTATVFSSFLAQGCVDCYIPENHKQALIRQTQEKDYIAVFEGMAGDELKKVSANFSNENFCSYTTYCLDPTSQLEIAKNAHQNGQDVSVIGFSSGGHTAVEFAKLCQKHQMPIKTLMTLDPTYLARICNTKVPSNVEQWINYRSNAPDFVGGRLPDRNCLQNPNQKTTIENYNFNVGHLALPKNAYKEIQKRLTTSVLLANR